MEETAYALALQIDVNIPIVLTGSMRPSHEPGADGPANLIRALRVATTPAAGRLGPVIVMQDEIHLARWVTKVHTSRVAAFSSPELGPVGHVVEGKVHLRVRCAPCDYLGMPDKLDKRVEIIWVSAGADGLLVDAAAAVAQGLIVAGTGGGHGAPQKAGSLPTGGEGGFPGGLARRGVDGPLLESTDRGGGAQTPL